MNGISKPTHTQPIGIINGRAAHGLTTLGSTTYYFTSEGLMLAGHVTYDYEEKCSYYADKNGNAVRLNQNGWTLVGNKYYYCENGMYVSGQVKLIGEKNYLFDYDGTMLNNDYMNTTWNGVRINVRAKAGGALAREEKLWYNHTAKRGPAPGEERVGPYDPDQ